MEDIVGDGGVPQEKGGSLGSELGPFATWPQAHGGPLSVNSCPAVQALPHVGTFARAKVRE